MRQADGRADGIIPNSIHAETGFGEIVIIIITTAVAAAAAANEIDSI
jgi:hypothetical protein